MKPKMKFFGIGLIAVFAAMGLYLWGQYTAQTGTSIEIVKEAEAAGGAKYSSNVKSPTGTMSPRDMYFPGTEKLARNEMRVISCGTGMPAARRSQAATCWLVELGNGDKFLFDIGTGSGANIGSLNIPYDYLDRVFVSHLHSDHVGDMDSLWIGGWTGGRHGALNVWGPSGAKPELGTKVVQILPSKESKIGLRAKYPEASCQPIPLRVVKYTVAGTTYILGTTLLDQQRYTIENLSNVYHSRWGVEELYKISKQLMRIEDFHGKSERGVKQELYAHFILITLTRIFSNHSEDGFNTKSSADATQPIKVNFKNSLITVARHIEGLLLQQAKLVTETINHIVASISSSRQKLRPNRSYDRCSRKPVGKWKPPKPAKPNGKQLPVTA